MFAFRFILLVMVLSVFDLTISVLPFGIFEYLLVIKKQILTFDRREINFWDINIGLSGKFSLCEILVYSGRTFQENI